MLYFYKIKVEQERMYNSQLSILEILDSYYLVSIHHNYNSELTRQLLLLYQAHDQLFFNNESLLDCTIGVLHKRTFDRGINCCL